MEKIDCLSSEIFFGPASQVFSHLRERKPYTRIAILCDTNTEKHCLPLLADALDPLVISIDPGEENKHIDTCKKVWHSLMEAHFDRHSLLVNLGGGVIGDLGGFCAATYLRGIDFVQVPTTLLAMVDASVGGKVGVDFELVKNAVGVFRQPTAVIIDEAFLETLPRRELLSGFAEVIKHALIANTSLWNQIMSYRHIDDIPWKLLLRPSIEIKKRIVEQDPYEGGMRKLLNFGHTVGHALESFSIAKGEALKHGEAVAMGMICEVILSEKILGLPKNETDRIVELILRHFSPFYMEERDFPELLNWMRKDKKNRQKKIGFTLLKKPGEAEFNIFLDEAEILHALKSYRDIVNSRMA